MPRRGRNRWNAKDERQYKHVLYSCKKSKKHPLRVCRRIAAATTQKAVSARLRRQKRRRG